MYLLNPSVCFVFLNCVSCINDLLVKATGNSFGFKYNVLPALSNNSSSLTTTSALLLPNKALSPGSGKIPELLLSLYVPSLFLILNDGEYCIPVPKSALAP